MNKENLAIINQNLDSPKQPYFTSNGVVFSNITFEGDGSIYLSSGILPRSFSVDNSEFEGQIKLNGSTTGNVIFSNCVFHQDVTIQNGDSTGKIELIDCVFNKDLTLKGKQLSALNIQSKISGFLNIQAGKFDRLEIGGGVKEKQYSINRLKIDFSNSTGIFFIHNLHLDNLKLVGKISKDSDVSIENSCLLSVRISDLSNDGKLRFLNLLWNDSLKKVTFRSFHCYQSNLGKTEFYNFDFNCFEKVEFIQSVLIECVFVNIVWPRHYYKPNLKLREWQLIELRDELRQLKYVLSKQGDSVREHEFHAFEMRTHLLLSCHRLSNLKGKSANRAYSWWQNLQNWVVLFLSWLSSNFGLSWLRPIFFMLVVNFSLIYLGLYGFSFQSLIHVFNFQSSLDFDAVGKFLYYCSPFRRFDNSITGKASIFDIAIRIVSSYGIYNFIRATRRYVK